MKTLARLVLRYPKTVIALVLLLTVFFGLAAGQVEQRFDFEDNLPKSDPRLATFRQLRDKYSGGDNIVIILSGSDLFSRESLTVVERLSSGVLNLEGVRKVTSLTNLTEFRGEGDGVRSGPLVAQVPETREECERLRARIMSDPWYVGRLVSQDGRSTVIVVNIAKLDTMEEGIAVLQAVRQVVDREKGGLQVTYAGSVIMDEEFDRNMAHDLRLLLPFVLVLVVAVLYLTFRNLRGVILPLVTVVMSALWTVGLMVLVGRPLSMVTNVMPVVLIGVGSAYGIHIVARFQEGLAQGLDKISAVRTSIERTGFGVWMAALTTVVGFGSLALSKLRMILDFGVFSAFGVLVAFLVSITFIPAVLTLLPARSPRQAAERSSTGTVDRVLTRFADFVVRRSWAILVVATLVVVLSLAGWPRIIASFEPMDFLPKDSGARRAERLVDAKFGGSAELAVLVKGDLSDLQLLKSIDRFQAEMVKAGAKQPISVVNLLARINRAFNGDDPAYERLPDDPGAIPQYLFLLSVSTTPEELAEFMSFDQKEALISARISNVMNTADRERLVSAVEGKAREVFGERAEVTVSGMPVMELAMIDIIRSEQLQNIVSSLVAVLLLVVSAFWSISIGVICVVPIAITVAVIFGFMGWAGIRLDFATAIISSLATGIGIDYSIHFYRRYQEECQLGRDSADAIRETTRTTGAAILSNAVAVGAGFAILLLSGFKVFRVFGGLLAGTMAVASLGALTVLPALDKTLRTIGGRNVKKIKVLGSTLVMVLLLSLAAPVLGAELSGRDIVKRMDDLGTVSDLTADLEMRTVHKSGQERLRRLSLALKRTPDGGEKMLMRFLVPADVKGTGFLSLSRPGGADEKWLYLPALKRPRRIASEERAGSFMGSDLTYEDVGSLKLDDYRHSLLRTEKLEGAEVYVVESLPASDKIKRECGFTRKTWWIRKDNFTVAKAEFTDGSGRLLKVLSGSEAVVLREGTWFTTRMEMRNLETGSRTLLVFKNIRVNTGVPDDFFTERRLTRAN